MPGKFFLEGVEFNNSAKYSEAVKYFTKALETEENPQIYYERALAYFHLKDNFSALKDMNTAQELEPENPFRYSSRAYIKGKSGDLEGAMNDYKKAIELDPEDAIAHNNLGLLEEKAGFIEMADKRFKASDEIAANMDLFEKIQASEKINANGFSIGLSKEIKIEKKVRQNFPASRYLREIYNVISKKSSWLEFLRFVKSGGKIR